MTKIDDLKNLPPEERIRRLKEIEEEDKRELEEAEMMIRESKAEFDEEKRKYHQVPVPQMKAIDIGSLFSPEEKEMFKAKRPSEAIEKLREETVQVVQETQTPLEETVEAEAPHLTREQLAEQKQYIRELATERPANDIYQGMASIAEDASRKGYLSADDQNQLSVLYNAAVEKNEAFQHGEYQANKTAAQDIESSLDLFRNIKKNYLQ